MRKLFAIAVAAALLVGITALAYGAGKGPAPKATGEVWLIRNHQSWTDVTTKVGIL